MDFKDVVKCVVNADANETKPFYFNQAVAEDLDFLVKLLKNSHSDEVKLYLTLLIQLYVISKGKHLKELEKQGIEVTPSEDETTSCEPWDIIDAMDEYTKTFEESSIHVAKSYAESMYRRSR